MLSRKHLWIRSWMKWIIDAWLLPSFFFTFPPPPHVSFVKICAESKYYVTPENNSYIVIIVSTCNSCTAWLVCVLSYYTSASVSSPMLYRLIALLTLFPEGRPEMSDVSPLSGISGLSFHSTLLSPLLFFCLVMFPILSSVFLPAGPFFWTFFQKFLFNISL